MVPEVMLEVGPKFACSKAPKFEIGLSKVSMRASCEGARLASGTVGLGSKLGCKIIKSSTNLKPYIVKSCPLEGLG
jgi:hypothetical protein